MIDRHSSTIVSLSFTFFHYSRFAFPPFCSFFYVCFYFYKKRKKSKQTSRLSKRGSKGRKSKQRCQINFNFIFRKDWGREVLAYRPVFQDGWSPGYVHIPDDDDGAEVMTRSILAAQVAKKASSITSESDDGFRLE